MHLVRILLLGGMKPFGDKMMNDALLHGSIEFQVQSENLYYYVIAWYLYVLCE